MNIFKDKIDNFLTFPKDDMIEAMSSVKPEPGFFKVSFDNIKSGLFDFPFSVYSEFAVAHYDNSANQLESFEVVVFSKEILKAFCFVYDNNFNFKGIYLKHFNAEKGELEKVFISDDLRDESLKKLFNSFVI